MRALVVGAALVVFAACSAGTTEPQQTKPVLADPAATEPAAEPEPEPAPETAEQRANKQAEAEAAAAQAKADESMAALARYVEASKACPVGPTPIFDEADMLLIQSTQAGRDALRVEMEALIEAHRNCPPSAGPAAP